MQPALGDRLFDLVTGAFVVSWAIGWVILLVVMGLQYVFPKREAALEQVLPVREGLRSRTEVHGLSGLTLLALRLVATWLGWAPRLRLAIPVTTNFVPDLHQSRSWGDVGTASVAEFGRGP